jgi:hypothetical protein
VRDIEELVQLGEKQRACPYYGTRAAVPSVEVRAQSSGAGAPLLAQARTRWSTSKQRLPCLPQVVALPYNMLLHRATRESLGVDLKVRAAPRGLGAWRSMSTADVAE